MASWPRRERGVEPRAPPHDRGERGGGADPRARRSRPHRGLSLLRLPDRRRAARADGAGRGRALRHGDREPVRGHRSGRARRPRRRSARARPARRRRVRALRRQRRERHGRVGRPPAPAGALHRGGGASHPAEPRHPLHAAARAARRARRGDRARRRRADGLRAAVARAHARRHDGQRLRGLRGARAAGGRGRGVPARGGQRVLRHRARGRGPERGVRGREAADLHGRPEEVGGHLAQGRALRDQLRPRHDHRREAHDLAADGEARGGQDRVRDGREAPCRTEEIQLGEPVDADALPEVPGVDDGDPQRIWRIATATRLIS